MVRGQQAEVVTAGNSEKRHLAGSLHWRIGRVGIVVTENPCGSATNADNENARHGAMNRRSET